jgi:hypothetical protein
VLEAADPPLTAGAPLDQPAASSRNRVTGHAKLSKLLVDAGLAVTTVGCHGAGHPTGPYDDPPDGGASSGASGGVRTMTFVVEHDPVGALESATSRHRGS